MSSVKNKTHPPIYIHGMASSVSPLKDITPPGHCHQVQLQIPGSSTESNGEHL